MKIKMNVKSLLLFIAIFFGMHLNAQGAVNKKNSNAKRAKISAAYALKLGYICAGFWHICAACVSANAHLNDKRSALPQYLQLIAQGLLTELSGVYGSFYSSVALSKYIKKLKEGKNPSSDVTQAPHHLDQESDEDADQVIAEILLHAWVTVSSIFLAYRDTESYRFAYKICYHKEDFKHYNPVESLSKFGLATAPVMLPSRLFVAYSSFKAILSKIKNFIPKKICQNIKQN